MSAAFRVLILVFALFTWGCTIETGGVGVALVSDGSDSTSDDNDGQEEGKQDSIDLDSIDLDDLQFNGHEDQDLIVRVAASVTVAVDGMTAEVVEQPLNGTLQIRREFFASGVSSAPVTKLEAELVYSPDADFNGIDTFRIAAVSGTVRSEALVTVNIAAVNDAPSITAGAAPLVSEDAGAVVLAAWATDLASGPADESGQSLNINTTNNNNALFAVQPQLLANGDLTFTPAADAFGSTVLNITVADDGGVANGGVDSATVQVALHVVAVNDAPSFVSGPSLVAVAEDSGASSTGWATLLSAGPANESGQQLSFALSNDNNTLFSQQPSISATGQLQFTPAPNAFGTANVQVQLQDDGGNSAGGVDRSALMSFSIQVSAVNDAPNVQLGAALDITEDAGLQNLLSWATLDAGPVNESTQTLAVTTTNSNPALFATQPQLTTNGTLQFATHANTYGNVTVTVYLDDNGGSAFGGVTRSVVSFGLNIRPVNDAPSFVTSVIPPVNEDSGPQSIVGWATSISPGPVNEASQGVSFSVSNNAPLLFLQQPTLAANGTLSYTPATDANGTATLQIQMFDTGGIVDGGVNHSAVFEPSLTIVAVNDAPGFATGGDRVLNEDAGAQIVPGWASSIVMGPGNESSQSVVSFVVSNDNSSLFAIQPVVNTTGDLSFTVADDASGSAHIQVSLVDDGGTSNGGTNTTTYSANILVLAVNDAPSFDKGGDEYILEDAGMQNVAAWATAISVGPPDEAGQVFSFDVSAENESLFLVQPSVNAAGDLSYQTVTDANGVSAVYLMGLDDGGQANGGSNRSFLTSQCRR